MVQVDQFQQLFDMQPDPETANYTLDVTNRFHQARQQHSLNYNPYFFMSPFSGSVAISCAFNFICRFMANHTAENPDMCFPSSAAELYPCLHFKGLKLIASSKESSAKKSLNPPIQSLSTQAILCTLKAMRVSPTTGTAALINTPSLRLPRTLLTRIYNILSEYSPS
jgi:hypothetical protein